MLRSLVGILCAASLSLAAVSARAEENGPAREWWTRVTATPIGGALLGGFVFEPIRNWIRRKPELKWYDHVGLIATDPIGALNYMAERLLGIKSDIRVGIPRGGGVLVEFRVPWN